MNQNNGRYKIIIERLIATNNHVHLYYYILPLYLQTGIVIFLLRDMKKFVRGKLRKLILKLRKLRKSVIEPSFNLVLLISIPGPKSRVCADVPSWHSKITILSSIRVILSNMFAFKVNYIIICNQSDEHVCIEWSCLKWMQIPTRWRTACSRLMKGFQRICSNLPHF